MFREKAADGLNLTTRSDTPPPLCADCMKGKMTRLLFPSGRNRATDIGQLIHSDVCGPMQVTSPGGARYYVIFKDDYSGWTVIHFIQRKSEVEEKFKNYSALLRVEKGKAVNTLRTDRGGEYVGKSFNDWLESEGIRHEMSAAYTPQQNGVSERYNRTEMESTRCLLFARKVPIELWAEAANYSNYIRNRVLSSTGTVTPYEIWLGKKPDLSHLRIFGSQAFIHIPDERRKKLDEKSMEGF
jgi:hypothetical protein